MDFISGSSTLLNKENTKRIRSNSCISISNFGFSFLGDLYIEIKVTEKFMRMKKIYGSIVIKIFRIVQERILKTSMSGKFIGQIMTTLNKIGNTKCKVLEKELNKYNLHSFHLENISTM